MAKLYYKYSTVKGSKSLDAIRTLYNYKENGMNALAFKPEKDIRGDDKECKITSRAGLSCNAIWINENENIFDYVEHTMKFVDIDVIVIDEVQFCTSEQILQLRDIVMDLNIPVLAYGLKTNFKGELFDSIKTLLSWCDDIQQIIGLCHCGKRANQNARVINGKIVKDGEEIQIGDKEYIPLCNKHFRDGILK